MKIEIELGPDGPTTLCKCCGAISRTIHGFIYDTGNARAIYYAGWPEKHPEHAVTMAIAMGNWDDGTDSSNRTLIGISARTTEYEIQFTILSPEESPWSKTDLLGVMLSRDEALTHPLLDEALALAEHIVVHDHRLANSLG